MAKIATYATADGGAGSGTPEVESDQSAEQNDGQDDRREDQPRGEYTPDGENAEIHAVVQAVPSDSLPEPGGSTHRPPDFGFGSVTRDQRRDLGPVLASPAASAAP